VEIDPFPLVLKYVGDAVSLNCSFNSSDLVKQVVWFIRNERLEQTNLSAVSIRSSASSAAIIPRIPSSYNDSHICCKVVTLSGVEINSSLTYILLQGYICSCVTLCINT